MGTENTAKKTADQKKNNEQQKLQEKFREEIKERVNIEVKPPPPDQFTIVHPVLTNIDNEILKLTAQFVAKNGQKFLAGLTERENQNPQFDFLKPTHGLFGYFTSLLDTYSKAMIPKKEQISKLQTYISDKYNILKNCQERFQYEKIKKDAEKKRSVVTDEEKM